MQLSVNNKSAVAMLDSTAFAAEWEVFCRADYEAYKLEHPQPFVANFYSGGNFYNALERWGDDWRKHYMRVGEKWWNERGFTVTSWPRREPITVAPIKTKVRNDINSCASPH